MATRRQHIKLGIFILAVALLLAVTLAFVGGQRLWEDDDTYFVISDETISGIDVDSPVTLRGVKVGQVSAVQLDRSDFGRVEVELAVDPEVAIPAQARAFFRRAGLTGQRVIDITGGTTKGGVLPPGSVIPRGATTLEELEGRADALTTEVRALIEQATGFVAELRSITESVEPARVEQVFSDVEEVVSSMVKVGHQLERAVGDGRKGVGRIMGRVDEVADGTTTVLDDLHTAAGDLQELLRHAKLVLRVNEDDLRATLGNLRRTTRNTERLSRELRLRPSLLLRSDPPKERELP